MEPNYVKFTDAVKFQVTEVPQKVRDFYADPVNAKTKPLTVRIAATHSGKVTRNNGFYLPHRMREGAKTFISQYEKPVQVHHDSKQDPIGRIVDARYVDISSAFRDSVQDAISSSLDRKLVRFIEGRLSMKDSVSFVSSVLIKDLKLVDDPNYEGLGYIEIIAEITDPDAIQKILDRRYLTGSVGATTDQAVCSVCKQDWAEEGRCDHRPGKVYDGAKCVIIAGTLSYDEYSFVNKPADRHSGIIEINVGGVQDFVYTDENNIEDALEVQLTPLRDTSQEDKQMLFKDALERVSTHEFFKEKEGLQDAVKAVLDNTELTDESKEASLERLVALQLGQVEDFDKQFPPENPEEEVHDDVDPIKDFFADGYEELVGDDAWGRQYAEMLFSLLDGVEDEEERAEITKQINDAKLSAAQRKKLSTSTFCGPDRSFPVNDCAHYTAALRLLSRYQGEGDKSRIRACIERKGKRLGCGGKKKDDAETAPSVYADAGYYDQFEENELIDMLTGLLKAMEERSVELPDCMKPDDSAKAELEAKLEAAAQDVVDKIDAAVEKEVGTIKKRLDAAHREIRYLHSDIEHLADAHATTQDELRESRLARITDLKRLQGEDVDFTQVSDEHKDKGNKEIVEILKDLTTQVDTKQIAVTLNSGLSNEPSGKLDDPTLPPQDNTKESSEEEQFDPRVRARVRQIWIAKMRTEGEAAAQQFLRDCVEENLIPASMLKEQS